MESETSITTQVLDLLVWLKANLRKVILATIVVAVLAIAITIYISVRGQREARASEALSEVHVPLNPAVPPDPGLPDSYLKVANEYPGTKAAMRALIQAGGAYYVQGKYKESQQQFERLLREYPENPWRAEATMGLAANFEALGKTNEAIAKYEEVQRNPAAAVADEAKLDLARLYEGQGKRVEALKMYEQLYKAYPYQYSALGQEAGWHLDDLTNRYPYLATNLTPIFPPTPTFATNRPPPRPFTNIPPQILTNPAALSNWMRARSNMMRMTNAARMTNIMRMTNLGASNVIRMTNISPSPAPPAAAPTAPPPAAPAPAPVVPKAPAPTAGTNVIK